MAESLYLGLDVGASNIRVGLGDEEDLYSDKLREVPTEDYWSEEGLRTLIIETLELFEISLESLDGVGIGVPGLVNTDENKLELCFALDELSFTEVSKLDIDISIENDANVAVMGEKFYGDGGNNDNIVTVIMGSGIGGGVYYGGELLGSRVKGRSPEPGGLSVEGETIWDEAVGGENLPEYMETLMDDEEQKYEVSDMSAEEVFKLSEDDEVIADYLEKLTELNAKGIANLVNLYAPELITFSGSVAVNNPEFIRKSFEKVDELVINPRPDMKISKLGNRLGLYGALALAQKADKNN